MAEIDDLKVKTDDQLQQQLIDLKREQFNLRFQSATNQLEKPSRVQSAPHHRAHQDAAERSARPAPTRGEGVRRV